MKILETEEEENPSYWQLKLSFLKNPQWKSTEIEFSTKWNGEMAEAFTSQTNKLWTIG